MAPEDDPDRRARLYDRPVYREILARISGNCRRLRKERGWTQLKTAVRAEMAKNQYQRVESGKHNVTATVLARLCDAFNVDVSEFTKPLEKSVEKGRAPKH